MTTSSSSANATRAKSKSVQPSDPATRKVTVQDVEFNSKALGRTTKFRVVLPPGYAESSHRYSSLYLLHGVFGGSENWETLTDITRYAASTDLIIVMPDAGNSWYVNSATKPRDRFEDFVMQDLLSDVEARFRALRSSHRRAIAGLSMGGYAAIKFAIKFPDTFAVAASISGALTGPLDLDNSRKDLRGDLRAAFGPSGSVTRRENDLFQLLPKADLKLLPYFYLDCGTADEFCEVNRRFAQLLCSRGGRYEYHEVPGAHSWQYWDQRIAVVLPFVNKKLRPAE